LLIFSSFFTYKEGFWKAFEAYSIWAKTGNKEHAFNGTWAYLKWCMKLEGPIIVLSVIGLFISVIKAQHRWAMFVGLWAWGLFAAYTIIPYKTPWLAISFVLPMCLGAGYAVGEMIESRNKRLRMATFVLLAASLALLCYQTFELNFVRYDDDQMGYVYAHTKHGYKDLIAKIEYYAEKSGKGTEAQVEIVSPDYWPMTWDLNKYGHAYFQGRLVDATTAEMIVSKKGEQDAAVVPKYSEHYKFAGYYPLRPGVDLVLLVRKDLADPDAQEINKILTLPALP
jgi:predicted membrane-bound mannosyltransferase